jgi:hypothetical protein
MIIREVKNNILKSYYNFRIGVNKAIYNLVGRQNDAYANKIWESAERNIPDELSFAVSENIATRILLKDKNKILKSKLEAIA